MTRELKRNLYGQPVCKYTNRGKLRKVYLVCTKCGKSIHIRTADKRMYTEEVRKGYVCLFCRIKKVEIEEEEIFPTEDGGVVSLPTEEGGEITDTGFEKQ